MTSDPAIYDYMSQSKNGEGGIYNITNLNLYHYAGNNPVKYTDPDGEEKYNVNLLKILNINTDFGIGKALQQAQDLSNMLNENPEYKEQMKESSSTMNFLIDLGDVTMGDTEAMQSVDEAVSEANDFMFTFYEETLSYFPYSGSIVGYGSAAIKEYGYLNDFFSDKIDFKEFFAKSLINVVSAIPGSIVGEKIVQQFMDVKYVEQIFGNFTSGITEEMLTDILNSIVGEE